MSIRAIAIDNSDPFYRYKRQVIAVEYKKGTTIITNMKTITRQLFPKRGPFPEEEDLQEQFELAFYKKVKNECATSSHKIGSFRGELSVEKLEEILQKMIVKYILCKKCLLPELYRGKCCSCGN